MKKQSKRNIVITGATGDIAQAIIKRLPNDRLFLLSRSLAKPNLPDHIDILINNAGFGVFAKLTDLTEQQIEEMFQVNTLDVIRLTKQLNPDKVINIASIAAKLPTAKSSVYAASKAAVVAFSDALRMEGKKVLTVNTGPVVTKFHQQNQAYLDKVGRYAISADFVAEKIINNFESSKRELNLPRSMAVMAKIRALAPSIFDRVSNKFFKFK